MENTEKFVFNPFIGDAPYVLWNSIPHWMQNVLTDATLIKEKFTCLDLPHFRFLITEVHAAEYLK